MKNRVLIALFAVAACIPQISMTRAADMNAQEMGSKLKTACQGDVDKLCSDITPGQGRIAACMDSKSDQLSSGCKSSWTTTKADISKRMDKANVAFRKDCGSDVQKFCSDVPSGQGRILDCLSGHKDGLSNSCKSFQAKLDQKLDQFFG